MTVAINSPVAPVVQKPNPITETNLDKVLKAVQIAHGVFGIGGETAKIYEAVGNAGLRKQQESLTQAQADTQKMQNMGIAFQTKMAEENVTPLSQIMAMREKGVQFRTDHNIIDPKTGVSRVDPNAVEVHPGLGGLFTKENAPDASQIGKFRVGPVLYAHFPVQDSGATIAGNKAVESNVALNQAAGGQTLASPNELLSKGYQPAQQRELGAAPFQVAGGFDTTTGKVKVPKTVYYTAPLQAAGAAEKVAAAGKIKAEEKQVVMNTAPGQEKAIQNNLPDTIRKINEGLASSSVTNTEKINLLRGSIDAANSVLLNPNPNQKSFDSMQAVLSGILPVMAGQSRASPSEVPYTKAFLDNLNTNFKAGKLTWKADLAGLTYAMAHKLDIFDAANASNNNQINQNSYAKYPQVLAQQPIYQYENALKKVDALQRRQVPYTPLANIDLSKIPVAAPQGSIAKMPGLIDDTTAASPKVLHPNDALKGKYEVMK